MKQIKRLIADLLADREAVRMVICLILTFILGALLAWAVVTATDAMTHIGEPVETTTQVEQATEQAVQMRRISMQREYEYIPNPVEVELIGRTIWGEAGGVQSKAERAAVAWCILNRVDAYGQSIEEVVTAPWQFHGYRTEGECPAEHLELAVDVLTRWYAEKCGATEVGRTLPADYLYFVGDGWRNHFSVEYESDDFWDWSLANPYN